MNLLSFLMIYYIYALNRSFLSKIISKYHASSIDVIMTLIVFIIALMLRFLCLVKCINTYFDSSNHASYHFRHSSAFFSLSCIFSAFSMSVSSCTSKAISSMNSSPSSLDYGISSRFSLQNIYNIEDNNDSCDISIYIDILSDMTLLNLSFMLFFIRKLLI